MTWFGFSNFIPLFQRTGRRELYVHVQLVVRSLSIIFPCHFRVVLLICFSVRKGGPDFCLIICIYIYKLFIFMHFWEVLRGSTFCWSCLQPLRSVEIVLAFFWGGDIIKSLLRFGHGSLLPWGVHTFSASCASLGDWALGHDRKDVKQPHGGRICVCGCIYIETYYIV